MRRKRKGQISFEFALSMAVGMFIVLTLVALFANKINEVMEQGTEAQIEAILDIITDEAVFAKSALPGYKRVYEIPSSVDGDNVSITLRTGYITLTHRDKEYPRGFPFYLNGSLCMQSLNSSTRVIEIERTDTAIIMSACPDCNPDYDTCLYYTYGPGCAQGKIDTGISTFYDQCVTHYCLC